jgi:hypothetical protein
MWEIMNIFQPARLIKLGKRMQGLKFDNATLGEKTVSWLMFLYMAWTLVGLFTFQWPVFLFYLAWSVIMAGLREITGRNANLGTLILQVFDGIVSLGIMMFILINAYHLQIDLWQLIKN